MRRVALSQRETALDRDFVLIVDAPAFEAPRIVDRERRGRRARDRARARAETAGPSTSPAEIVFVVDRSGSMAGHIDRRGAERAAALSALHDRGLPVQHHRVRLDDGCTLRRVPRLRPRRACRSARKLRGKPRGGSRWHRAPARDHGSPWNSRSDRWPGRIVVLTDGQITNTDAALELAATHARPRADLHVRNRRRREPSSRQGAGAGRRRHSGVHLPRRAHRTKGGASVRASAVARVDQCVRGLGGPRGYGRASLAAADLFEWAADSLWLPPQRSGAMAAHDGAIDRRRRVRPRQLRAASRSLASCGWPHCCHARGASPHPRARRVHGMDRDPRLASARPEAAVGHQRDCRVEHPIRPDLAGGVCTSPSNGGMRRSLVMWSFVACRLHSRRDGAAVAATLRICGRPAPSSVCQRCPTRRFLARQDSK